MIYICLLLINRWVIHRLFHVCVVIFPSNQLVYREKVRQMRYKKEFVFRHDKMAKLL